MEKKSFSFGELKEANATRYTEVEAYGGIVTLGSVNSKDMIEWIESNDNPETKRFGGIRLIVKSVVEVVRRDEEGNVIEARRIPEEQRESFLAAFQQKDATENGKVVRACLQLNGLDRAAAKIEALKKDSGVANPDASPTGSPSQQGA